MVPTARKKMQSYLQKQEAGTSINPHGPSSPPLQTITISASQPGMSAPSPVVARQDRLAVAEAMKIPMPVSKPSRLAKPMQPASASPQLNDSIPQQRNAGHDGGPDWESPAEEQQREEGGLREVWDEQSTIHSLFSEEEPNRPGTAQPTMYNKDDASSDIIDDRQPPRRSRNLHHRVSESTALFKYEAGEVRRVPSTMPVGFSTSMITHAPINARADAPVYREDPFGSTTDESSPKPSRDPSFLRSKFPIRGGEETKRLAHLERASNRIQSAKRISPETYDSASDIAEPQAYVKPVKEPAPVTRRSKMFQAMGDAVMDWDGDDSDSSSEDDFDAQGRQGAPNAARNRTVPDDATVILNPVNPAVPQKPQKSVVLQDPALPESPMPRAPVRHHSPSRKRRRNIDYDDAALEKMSFEDLQNEPFDHDPTREMAQSPAKPPADNLGDRLMFYSSKDENAQADFFTQMPVREWEDSGDWLLEQFGDIVSKMKETRQMKRKIVEQYETEVSNREEDVRRKKESIDRKLLRLKHDSAAMLGGDKTQD